MYVSQLGCDIFLGMYNRNIFNIICGELNVKG